MPRPPLRIDTSATSATTQVGAALVKWITSAASAMTPESASGHQGFFTGAARLSSACAPSSIGSASMPMDLIASMIGAVLGRSWVTPSTRLIRLNSSCCTPASLPSLFWISVCSVGQSMASMRKRLRRAPSVGASLIRTSAGAAALEQQEPAWLAWSCFFTG
ncbi:hypothetical protein D3C81_1641710 [compost metagenome]